MIYLDHNATTPLSIAAQKAMQEAQSYFANPSSIHQPGRHACRLFDEARRRLASTIGALPEELIFAASGSEANNLALKGTVFAHWPEPTHLIISAIEHDSILQTARWLAAKFAGVTLTEVAPDFHGRVDPEDILNALRPETRLVSLMLANHETGMIQPVSKLTKALKKRDVMLHSDVVQAFGRISVNVTALGCDMLTLSAHKFNGPKGVGLLYARTGTSLTSLVHGGNQEQGMRAGTANLSGVIGMATSAQEACIEMESTRQHLLALERIFWKELEAHGLSPMLNGDWRDKLPGTLNLTIPGLSSEDIVVGLDVAGVAVSAGSACASGIMGASPVLKAMRLPQDQILGGIRISFGRENTCEEAKRGSLELLNLARRMCSSTAAEVRVQ